MDSDKNKQALTVSRAEAGQKLLNFLQRRVEAATGEFHRWIRTGQVRVNGSRAKAFDRVEEGDLVVVTAGTLGHSRKNEPATATNGMRVVVVD